MSGWETALIISTIVGTSATIYSNIQQGKAMKAEARRQQTAAEIETTAREIQRTKRMNAFLASTNAAAGAGGVNPGVGSAQNLQAVAAREHKIGMASEDANRSAVNAATRDRIKFAGRQSLVNNVAAVGQGVSDVATMKLIKA